MIAEIIVLLLAIPAGYFIAAVTGDELVQGRKWFYVIIIAAVFVGGWFYLTGKGYITLTCAFAVIVSFISLVKSKDKKWVKKRI
jgi:ribose/xylose/arabinose/galactoside ABC-type transport system permease subunit